MNDLHAVDILWQQVIEGVSDIRTKLSLKQGLFICADENNLFVIFVSAFHHAAVSAGENRSLVERVIQEVFGGPYVLRCVLVPTDAFQRLEGHFYTSHEALLAAISK